MIAQNRVEEFWANAKLQRGKDGAEENLTGQMGICSFSYELRLCNQY